MTPTKNPAIIFYRYAREAGLEVDVDAILEAVDYCASLVVSDVNWPPTASDINSLPTNLRRYIHDLETNADPAGSLRHGMLIEHENEQLRKVIEAMTKVRKQHGLEE